MRCCSPSRYSVSTVSSVRQTMRLGGNIRRNGFAAASAAERHAGQRAHRIGDRGGQIADQELAKRREGDATAGEQRGAGADRRQGNAARDDAGDDRRSAAEKQERRDRENGADRKQQERGGGRSPGRAAERVGVDAELLADQRVERGVLV